MPLLIVCFNIKMSYYALQHIVTYSLHTSAILQPLWVQVVESATTEHASMVAKVNILLKSEINLFVQARRLLPTFIFVLLLAGCDQSNPETQNLNTYISDSSLPLSRQLIACAGGGAQDVQQRADAPISIYFYPIDGAGTFRYYETMSINQDPNELDNYLEVNREDMPFFNGYLWRFLSPPLAEERWGRVTFETRDSLHVSNAIRLKYPIKPTLYDSSAVIVQANGINPTFTWPTVNEASDAIYFQVVSDRNGNLISGTYTFEKAFTFYDLENVVLNIRDVSPPPMLDLGENYTFTLMTVSEDNWVNLIAQRQFTAQ